MLIDFIVDFSIRVELNDLAFSGCEIFERLGARIRWRRWSCVSNTRRLIVASASVKKPTEDGPDHHPDYVSDHRHDGQQNEQHKEDNDQVHASSVPGSSR